MNDFIKKLEQNLDKITNLSQIGGIETAVLDNGKAKGTRVAYFNTGAGLRFKVVLDRAMDIAEASVNAHNLAWISKNGVMPPETCLGMDWLKRFGGGLLTTCGLSHVGGAEKNNFGEFCLHDDISNTPAQVESIIQPRRENDYTMSVEGVVLQSTVFGAHLQLRRKISAKLGENKITVEDAVTNLGNEECGHMILYHANLGYPLIDEGTKLNWRGSWKAGNPNDPVINDKNDFTLCQSPTDLHSGAKESVAFIDIEADENGICTCSAENKKIGVELKISFSKDVLPWLINWQHWGKGEYVCALEPATNPPIGQRAARESETVKTLLPDETVYYKVEFEIVNI